MSSNGDPGRAWPYATITNPKHDTQSGLTTLQRHHQTRWVECRELPSVNSHEEYDLELQRDSSNSETEELTRAQNGEENSHQADISPGWIQPWTFLTICWKSSSRASMLTNSLWPFTIAAMILHYCYNANQLWIFVTAYVGMVPAANLVGFAGHQLAQKLPTSLGVLVETAIGSCVELVLLSVLIQQPGDMSIRVIRAVILGSILANLLLCLGLCFFVGGIYYPNQEFHVAISEVACNLMLVAGMGLIIPSIFYHSLALSSSHSHEFLDQRALRLSRVVAVVLLAAFLAYLWFQTRSHFGLYQDILQSDEGVNHQRRGETQNKAYVDRSIVRVQQIEYIVIDRNLSEEFKGLILVPVVEKIAEHLTAMHKAHQNRMNYALAQVLGSSIQTALLNTPFVILLGWALGKDMSLNFEIFDAVMLILAVVVVGSFLRDGKSDYLEGMLSVLVYLLIAVSAYYYPNPTHGHGSTHSGEPGNDR
ncbi:hypothetical protein Q7P37_004008 [Cladosporium fusiforme]